MHRQGQSCLKEHTLRAPHCSRFRQPTDSAPQSGIRQELVDRIRREIAEGTYDTPEKWEAALDLLLRQLDEQE